VQLHHRQELGGVSRLKRGESAVDLVKALLRARDQTYALPLRRYNLETPVSDAGVITLNVQRS
jgi:hypothetical protein